MSEFSDFMTMKIIAQRRLESGSGHSASVDLWMHEQMKAVKNINVRAPVTLIGQIEVLADFLGLSKAELVVEMLGSSLKEAYVMIEKEGWLDKLHEAIFNHMEKNYGAIVKRDANGKAVSFSYPEEGIPES